MLKAFTRKEALQNQPGGALAGELWTTRCARIGQAEEALSEYLAIQEWQVAAIEEAVREVEAGAPMVEHAHVVAWLRSWGSEEELPPPQ